MRDLSFALRTLTRTPVVSIVAILSLALGIGANTAIFSLFEQTLMRSLPAVSPGQLVNITANGSRSGSNSTNNAGGGESIFSYPMFRDLEREQTVFTGIAAHRSFGANLAYQGQTSSANGMMVSGSYFPVLGLRPALGRLFTPEDDRTAGAHRLTVLGYSYWTERFNRNPSVLNQPLLVNGVLMTIVGVAPAEFHSTTLGEVPKIFVPISMREELTPGWKGLNERKNYWVYLFARLKPEVSLSAAQSSINAKYLSIIREVDLPLQKGASDKFRKQFVEQQMTLTPGERGQSQLLVTAKTPFLFLFCITGFVLLIACANIANLLLARSANRAKEFSIRLSLGARRGQVIRQLLVESLVLALLAGVAGLFVADLTSRLMLTLLPPDSDRIFKADLRVPTMLFAMGVSIVAGFLFGLFPAIHSTRQDLAGAMKDQAGNVSASSGAARFRRTLVTAQVALSLLLLISAGLFLKSLVNVLKVDLGIRTQGTIVFGLSPDLNKYSPQRTRAFFEQLEASLSNTPGVTGIAASSVNLLAGNNWGSNVSVDGFQAGPDTDTHSMFNRIGPGYFRTLGIPLVAGREFTSSDAANAPQVAIVNEAFARKFSPNQSILGKRMQQGAGGKNEIEIVGIAKDAKYSDVKNAIPAQFFLPYRQDKELGSSSFYVTTSGPTEAIIPVIRQKVAELDPNLPVESLKTLSAQIDENIALDRMISTLAAGFAALATLLAAVGLYGVLSFTVARRTREIGIRLAVGADAASIRNMVLREVLWMLGIGIIIGIPGALLLAQYAESLLYGLKSYDPAVMVAAVVSVIFVSLLAAYIPAWRAMKIDPMSALRYE